jgi:hypothetical protein
MLTTEMRIPPFALCAIAADDAQKTSNPAKSRMIRFIPKTMGGEKDSDESSDRS